MRRYHIVSGILLILSIFDVALTAPVLVQEKRQASADVVHMPRGVITGWWKRLPVDEELERLVKEYLKTSGKSVESSDAHASSSSALPGPDHGSTNVVQTSVPNPASSDAHVSTANPGPSMESSTSESEHGMTWELQPNKRPWTNPDGPVPDPDYWMGWNDPPPKRPALSILDPEPVPVVNPLFTLPAHEDVAPFTLSTKPTRWYEAVTPFTLSTEPTHWHEVVTPFTLSAKPAPFTLSKEPTHQDFTPFTLSAEAAHEGITPFTLSEEPPHKDVTPFTESTDPEIHLDHQSLSTDSQPMDLQAAIHAAKGKAKESRHISSPTRDIGNAA